MERIEKTVFISYRRTNFPWALAIFKDLTHYGYDVFFDFNGIASGDFERVIFENITARAHFLVLLTPSALERCGDPGDLFRREIEAALENQRNIIPVMLDGFDFGTPAVASQLTGALATLKHYNALRIPTDYFEEALDRLRKKFLSLPLAAVLHPASLTSQISATEQKTAAEAAPAVREEDLTAQQWFERGFAATDIDEQVRFFGEAIQLNRGDAMAFYNRGNAHRKKGDFEKALRDYSEAIRLKPDFVEAFANRGAVRHDQDDVEGALQDLNDAIRLKPDDLPALTNRGIARNDKGDLEGALNDYDEAIRLKPDSAVAFCNRASLRSNKGDIDGALPDCDEAIRLKPDFAGAFYCRANARRVKGDLEGALEDYGEAIRLKPDFAEAFGNRGIVRSAKGDLEGALKDYDEAVRLAPGDALALNNRASARQAKGDAKGALEDYSEAVRLGYKAGRQFAARALPYEG